MAAVDRRPRGAGRHVAGNRPIQIGTSSRMRRLDIFLVVYVRKREGEAGRRRKSRER